MAKKKIPRIATFDILRGYFLIGIFIDHLSFFPNGLDWISARGGLFVTMAEGFFLISGIILGIVRGSKLMEVPFRKVARLLLSRGFQLYVTSIVLTFIFTLVAWRFFMDTPGLKYDVAPPNTPIWQLIWDTVTLRYFYGWADYLRLYAVFLFVSPLMMWLLRRGWWYVGLLMSVGVWLLFPDPQIATGMEQERAQLLSWQLIFFIGMTIGFYWNKLQETWASLSRNIRRTTLVALWSVASLTLLYNVAIMLAAMGHDMSFIGISYQTQHNLYVAFFDKEQLPLARIILFMIWFWAAFALVRTFEEPIKKWFGWLLITYGTNSLYVYTVHAFIIFFVQLYFVAGSIWFNFMISLAGIFVTLLMIRYKVLTRVIPR
jgi:hypothetical protein